MTLYNIQGQLHLVEGLCSNLSKPYQVGEILMNTSLRNCRLRNCTSPLEIKLVPNSNLFPFLGVLLPPYSYIHYTQYD